MNRIKEFYQKNLKNRHSTRYQNCENYQSNNIKNSQQLKFITSKWRENKVLNLSDKYLQYQKQLIEFFFIKNRIQINA